MSWYVYYIVDIWIVDFMWVLRIYDCLDCAFKEPV